jgi:outer membrane protein assembly factor BamA
MSRRVALPSGLLALIFSLIYVVPSRAQFPKVPKRCSRLSVEEDDAPYRKVIIEGVDFDGPIHLSQSDINQIIAHANRIGWHADNPEWVKGFAQIGLRGAWLDRGYFRVNVSAKASSLGGDPSEEHFLVTAHIDEGLQYHLGDLRFVGDSGIPEAELRAVFPLRGGELFSVPLIREGIQALTKLYASHGYIDFTTVPETEVDDNLQRISLVLKLDQEKQFRVGKVEIIGVDPNLESDLRVIVRPGEIFNQEAVYEFLRHHLPTFPSSLSSIDALEARRSIKTGIVDLTFDFRSCP